MAPPTADVQTSFFDQQPTVTLVEAVFPQQRREHLLGHYAKQLASLNVGLADARPLTSGMPSPLGPTLWLADSSSASNAIREQLVEQCNSPLLQPEIRTLRQAAETLASMADQTWHPLSKVQQRWLVGKIADEGRHRDSLGPLKELAASRGLVDLLTHRFDQLRELGLSVEAAGNHLRKNEGRVGNAISRLYETYSDRLHRFQLLDKAGRFELACREVVRRADRFALFAVECWLPTSPIERKFFRTLVSVADETLVAVAGRKGSVSLNQTSQWQKLLDCETEVLSLKPVGEQRSKTLVAVSQMLFDEQLGQEPNEPLTDDETVEVLATISTQDELRQVGRRIKRLLVEEGVEPQQVLVATRQIGRIGNDIEAALDEYGIPNTVESYPLLKSSPWFCSLLQLLEVVRTDWQQEPLLALLGRREFAEINDSERRHAELLVRELGLPSGGRYLLQQAETLASRSREPQPPRLAGIANRGHGALISLSEVFEKFPEEASPLAWFDVLCQATEELKYTFAKERNSKTFQFDQLARETLETAFFDLELLAQWRSAKQKKAQLPQLTLNNVSRLVADWGERLTLVPKRSEEGRVRVVSTETARSLDAEHLFIVALDESSFASQARQSDATTVETTDGSAQKQTAEHSVERLLFHQLVALPRKSLTLSYAALDEKAVLLHPSAYLTEVERLFSVNALRRETFRLGKIDIGSIPFSPREQRLQAVGKIVEGVAAPMATLLTQQAMLQRASLCGSLEVVAERWQGDSFGPTEGVFSVDRVTKLLTERYGPEHHWSASQLEMYASCPFKFFSRYVLGAVPLADSQFEVDYRRRGTLLHDAMVELHLTLKKRLGTGDRLSDLDREEISLAFRDAIEFVGNARGLPSHEIALGEIEQKQANSWADVYPDQILKFDQDKKWASLDDPLKPRYFEARFGPARGAAEEEVEDEISTDEPYRLGLPSGEELLLTGKIDRIDVGQIGLQTVFGIVDYKTGSISQGKRAEIESGEKLQLALYALAAEELFFGSQNAVLVAAGYWAIKEKGFLETARLELAKIDTKGATRSPDWAATIEIVRQRVEEIVQGVRQGEFPMSNQNDDCGSYCDYRTICRVNQARNRDKLWPPPTAKEAKPQASGKGAAS